MEARIIKHLVALGFSNKWMRPRGGLSFGLSKYTPDVELCILHDSMNRRALVEFKPFSITEFTPRDRRRMLAAAHFYKDALCFLYISASNQWYLIDSASKLLKTGEPVPGGITFDKLPRPRFAFPLINRYGRLYYSRPFILVAKLTADGLEFVVKTIFDPTRRTRRRRRRF